MPLLKLKKPGAFQLWLAQPQPATPEPVAPTNASLPVLVIGSGPAGLAAMSALKRAGVAFEGIELHRQVGGIWDQSNPISSVYDGMQTNTSRFTTHLGPLMPAEWPAYPDFNQAHGYLVGFAEQEGLMPHIQFSTRFETATKTARGTWLATLHSGEGREERQREVRSVVFATGVHHSECRVFPQRLWDDAAGCGLDVIHSSSYRNANRYAGKRVLIVGIGNSGADIADKVSRHAARTLLAVRSTPWIIPNMVFGRPSDALADDTTSCLPHWVQMAAFQFIVRLYVGHPSKLGLPAPNHRLLDRISLTDRGIVQAVRHGRVQLRSNVAAIKDGCVSFEGAEHPPEPIDAVIFATGYKRKYPLLGEAEPGSTSLSDALSFLIFHHHESGLAYMSETVATRGCWPIFASQAKALAAYYAAEQRGGHNVQAFNARRTVASPDFKGHVFSRSDGFYVDYHIYTRALRDFAEWFEQ